MIVDIRDYTMVPGGRAKMIERFEALFMDEQERLGARVLGLFLDADDDAKAVWLRATPDMDTRKRVLTEFYANGELWRTNKDEVNSWFIDTDDVLLARPTTEMASPATGPSIVGMYTHVGPQPLSTAASASLQRDVGGAIADAGGRLLVTFATDPVENNYPKHAVRSGEHGLIWYATFSSYAPLPIASVRQRRLVPTKRSRMR